MSNEQMTDDQFNARLAEPIVSHDHLFRLMIDMAEQDDGIGQLSGVIWDKMKELKEELEESEKEKGQMAGNGGFCGDPETSECANAMFWRMGRDRMKSLEEENKKLKEKVLSRQDIRDLVDEHFHGEGMGGDLGHHCIYDWYTDSEEESEEESDDDSEEDQFERDGMGAILGVKTVVTK